MTPTLAELYNASDSDPSQVVAFLRALVAGYDVAQPPHVLDLGCGPGRLLAPLERLRWQVTGMEPHPGFVAAAREVARGSRRVSVRECGFLDLDDEAAFDVVIAVNSAFAHLLSPADRADALQRIHTALRPGGVVFLDLPNFLWLLKHYRAPEPYAFTALGREVTLHRHHEIDFHAAVFTTTDEYVFAGETAPAETMVHAYGMSTPAELRHHLDTLGFGDVRTFNGYDSRGSETLDGPRILMAARKPTA